MFAATHAVQSLIEYLQVHAAQQTSVIPPEISHIVLLNHDGSKRWDVETNDSDSLPRLGSGCATPTGETNNDSDSFSIAQEKTDHHAQEHQSDK